MTNDQIGVISGWNPSEGFEEVRLSADDYELGNYLVIRQGDQTVQLTPGMVQSMVLLLLESAEFKF